jgi:protein-L-isoaspartate(D-aspartate) O-methyltransferase
MAARASEDELRPLRDGLVEQLRGGGHIVSPLIEEAFGAVPRHLILPGEEPRDVYRATRRSSPSGERTGCR